MSEEKKVSIGDNDRWENPFIPVIACRDNDGHWYVIPAEKEEEFSQLLDKSNDRNLPEDEMYAAEEKFIEKFSEYMTGGDLNLTQLYMRVDPIEDEMAKDYPLDVPEPGQFEGPAPVHTIDEVMEKDFSSHYAAHQNAKAMAPKMPTTSDEQLKATAIAAISNLLVGVEISMIERVAVQNFLYQTATPKPSALEMVEEFHQAFGCPVYVTPTLPTYRGAYAEIEDLMEKLANRFKYSSNTSRSFLRMKLIFEEYKELCEGMRDGNYVKILDGLCDLLYVVYGTAHEFGLGPVLKEAFREVHRSNMSKLGADGKPVMREDGKVLKGPNFTPPDLARIIAKANTTQADIDETNQMLRNNTMAYHDPNVYPDWNTKTWREACDQAIKEGPKEQPDLGFRKFEFNALKEAVEFGLSAQLGASLPEIPGMPDSTNEGIIYSDLKVGEVTQNEDGGINVEIHATKITPVDVITATIEFKQPNDAYERQVTDEQPPVDHQYY